MFYFFSTYFNSTNSSIPEEDICSSGSSENIIPNTPLVTTSNTVDKNLESNTGKSGSMKFKFPKPTTKSEVLAYELVGFKKYCLDLIIKVDTRISKQSDVVINLFYDYFKNLPKYVHMFKF